MKLKIFGESKINIMTYRFLILVPLQVQIIQFFTSLITIKYLK